MLRRSQLCAWVAQEGTDAASLSTSRLLLIPPHLTAPVDAHVLHGAPEHLLVGPEGLTYRRRGPLLLVARSPLWEVWAFPDGLEGRFDGATYRDPCGRILKPTLYYTSV